MQVYFDQAIIQSGKANIEVDISFSGVELYFPKSWEVVNQTNTSSAEGIGLIIKLTKKY